MGPGVEGSDSSREAGPSGVQVQNSDQNGAQQYRGAGHNCQGARCVCQRYENGELAVAVMNQNRGNQEREENYQNIPRGARGFQNRPAGSAQAYPNLNPNYQNPVDLVRNYNRGRQQQEPEENIYERLDNDDDDDQNNRDAARNEPAAQNNQNNMGDHTYERIDDRHSCGGRGHCRSYKYHVLNPMPGPSFLSDTESRNLSQYDQPRNIYLDSSRLSNQFCQNRLGRLGRNCFSTENIAYAASRRSTPPLGYNCMCPFCRQLKHLCQHYNNYRLRCCDGLNTATMSNPRHYIYQLSRSCRCPFCRGEYTYVKLPMTACRPTEPLRVECHCRNPNNCSCRNKILPSSNSAVQFGRYLDWINRADPSVNNPMYATIHIGRIDRSCISNSGNATASTSTSNNADSGASASNATPSTSTSNAPAPSTSRAPERQHTCDDSCIRNQNGHVAGICQFLGRCDRAECNHNRLSVHWWFVNRWLPSWNSHNPDRNLDTVPPTEEEPREQHDTDTDDP